MRFHRDWIRYCANIFHLNSCENKTILKQVFIVSRDHGAHKEPKRLICLEKNI